MTPRGAGGVLYYWGMKRAYNLRSLLAMGSCCGLFGREGGGDGPQGPGPAGPWLAFVDEALQDPGFLAELERMGPPGPEQRARRLAALPPLHR